MDEPISRRLAQDLSYPLITTLQQECTRASCPEMKAGEWLYLCVAHGNDGAMEVCFFHIISTIDLTPCFSLEKHCCAIDYILHTVDSATALLNSPRTFPSRYAHLQSFHAALIYIFFFSRLQIPVASHRHFSSLARRLGRIFAHAYFHHREAFEQAEAESSLYARFLALTERFELVPAEFLVIPTDGHSVGGVGDSLGPPPSRSPRDEHRRSNEFDRGYLQQQQRTRYDLDLANFHHPNFPERNPSPPEPFSSESTSGGIGESPSPSTRTRIGRTRTGTMVFAEAEANTVTDELAARSSLREREQEPQKIELLERDKELMPLKTVIPATTVNEEEDVQFDITLSSETGKSGEEANDSVASEVFEEIPEPMEKDELPSLLDLKLEPEEAVNTAEIPVLPSAPAEPEVKVPTLHSSTEDEPAEPTVPSTEVQTDDNSEIQPILVETTTAHPLVSSIDIKSDDSSETQPILIEKTTSYPPANDNVSLPEPTLIPKETPETVVASQPEEVATKADAAEDKEIIPPSVIDDSELPTIVDEIPTDETQPEAIGEVVTEEKKKA